MTIRYTILGLLAQQPQSGYDLKKAISTSPLLHWSGNSNQVYTALLELNAEGCVEVIQGSGEGYPGKKIYRLTLRGQTELRAWLNQPPALLEVKNHFLVQFLFSDQISLERLLEQLDAYAEEIRQALVMQQESLRRETTAAGTPDLRSLLSQLAGENLAGLYQQELNWIAHTREFLSSQFE